MNHKLYVRYGSRNQNDGIISFANVGMTEGRDVESRFRDYDYRRKAAGGKWERVGEWDIGLHRDGDIHAVLDKLGYVKDPESTGNTEEYEFNLSKEDIHKLISEIVIEVKHGVSNRLNDFKMRPHQQECHDKVIKAFSNGYDKFLIGAIMRFGKTFTTYQIMKTLGSNLTFVVTYKTNDVVKAWRDELENHVDFKDYHFLNVKDCNLDSLQGVEKSVVFVSIPYLLNDAGAKDKSWIYKLEPDLLIVDEQHYGSATPNFKEIVEKLNPKKRIDLSGTPYKALMRGSYPDECVYRWDNLPIGMNLFVIDLAKEVAESSERAGFIDEDGFHINKFFAADKNGFIFHADVESAMIKLFGKNPFARNKHLFSPFSIREIQDKQTLNHILMRLESVDSAIAMEKMLTDMRPDYKIIRAAGSDSLAIKDAEKLQSIISESNKSITITAGRFETGVTIPPWGTVMPLHAGSSPESYTQTAYRGASECKTEKWTKKTFNVIDPDPNRALEVVYTSRAIMKRKGDSLKQSFEEFFDCANVYAVDGNRFVKLTSDQLINKFETFLSKRDPASEIRSEYGMNNLKLSANAIVALAGIDATKAKNISLLMTNNNLPKGKIKKRAASLGLDPEEGKKVIKTINDLIEKMKTVCSRIPIVVFAKEYVDLDSLLADTNNKTFFKKVTGITIDDYRDMLNTGALDRDWQDRAIIRINNLSETIKPEVY
jgi:type I site-specific restriction endonuclease